MRIRRDDVCGSCGVDTPAGTNAYWIASEKVVRCVECQAKLAVVEPVVDSVVTAAESSVGRIEAAPAPPAPPAPPVPVDADEAGASAQSEYEKRSARELARKTKRVEDDAEWRRTIKERRPVLGRIASTVTPKPQITPESQPTTAWKIGAEGERRVAEVLADAVGLEVLHDRLVPGSKANIDHIVVGPAGVFVIDAKKYKGRVETRVVGGFLRGDLRLSVNGRDRTKVVDGVLGQMEVVRTALGDRFADVDVHGVLCFVGGDFGFRKRHKRVRGVTALWPKALAPHVSKPGDLGDRVGEIADHLRGSLRPA